MHSITKKFDDIVYGEEADQTIDIMTRVTIAEGSPIEVVILGGQYNQHAQDITTYMIKTDSEDLDVLMSWLKEGVLANRSQRIVSAVVQFAMPYPFAIDCYGQEYLLFDDDYVEIEVPIIDSRVLSRAHDDASQSAQERGLAEQGESASQVAGDAWQEVNRRPW